MGKKIWNYFFTVGLAGDRSGHAIANHHAAPGPTSSFGTHNCVFLYLLFRLSGRISRASFGKLSVDHEKTALGLTHQF